MKPKYNPRISQFLVSCATASLFFCGSLHAQQRLTSYVDPFIGSGGHGHVFVGASVPFGAVQLGPENIFSGWDWCSGYNYPDSILVGFSHTHLSGTGIPDLGDVLIMPYTGDIHWNKGSRKNIDTGYASLFSHQDEKSEPGYYSVKLARSGIQVELTATERVGFHQYHIPSGKDLHIIIDLKEGTGDRMTDADIKQVDEHTLEGYRFSKGWANDQRLYFTIRSEQPMKNFTVQDKKGLITWDHPADEVRLKVGISPVSAAGALANIEAESPGWDFNSVRKDAEEKWNSELSRVQVEARNDIDRKLFYTALYHTMIDPAIFNDHNGDYMGTDKKIYRGASFTNYSVFSLWDTYRANHPLYTLIQPDRVNDLIQTMLAIYQQQGKLPVWHLMGCETNTMPGTSGVQVVAEAYLKGYRGFDTALALAAIKGSDMRNEAGLDYVRKQGYIPCDKVPESVAKAMEYCISDGSAALMARKMGRKEDYAWFAKRALNYRNYFDSSVGFFRGRRADGSWNPVFDPARTSHPWIDDYAEGNAWQYLWLVPEDVEGLIKLLGGDKAFVRKLDQLFKTPTPYDPKAPPDIAGLIGQYAHGNEPGHHTTYLYAYGGAQWKTAEKVRYILKNMYQAAPDGVSGNEDCGQMSAWYVFSAMGFYPVFPASGAYVLGSPLMDKVTISLPEEKSFIVEAVNNSPQNIYIQSVEMNGRPYTRSYILHQDILKGGSLRITMGSKPNYQFGAAASSRPRSDYSSK
ncbi:MAG: sugar hydrolase [Sphingobacteriales bacterium 50-39]|nr:GH92 family glycosyl hydrolase [Sphingobacteriales bacterium]OJW61241.1 MAG: sugar hydrolase [Sphingobacteriales bacterium 50-39]